MLTGKGSDEDQEDDHGDGCQDGNIENPDRFEPKARISMGNLFQGISDLPDVGQEQTDHKAAKSQQDIAEYKVQIDHDIEIREEFRAAGRESRRDPHEEGHDTDHDGSFVAAPFSFIHQISCRDFEHGDGRCESCDQKQSEKQDPEDISPGHLGDDDGKHLEHQAEADLELLFKLFRA